MVNYYHRFLFNMIVTMINNIKKSTKLKKTLSLTKVQKGYSKPPFQLSLGFGPYLQSAEFSFSKNLAKSVQHRVSITDIESLSISDQILLSHLRYLMTLAFLWQESYEMYLVRSPLPLMAPLSNCLSTNPFYLLVVSTNISLQYSELSPVLYWSLFFQAATVSNKFCFFHFNHYLAPLLFNKENTSIVQIK